jgi:two-component system C4-dicarboxylate transport sensor histidine kinase DctB
MTEGPETKTVGAFTVELGGRALGLDDLAHVNRMTTIGAVLPNVAHEVNNALQIIGGLAEMLCARADLAPDVVDKLARVSAQSARATGLVRDLVAFARRERASVALADVSRVAETALALRRYHLSRDRVAVTLDGAAGQNALCRLDAHYLQQVLVNLLLNAEQAVRGQPQPAIRVAVTIEGERVAVAVEDNGRGLGDGIRRAGEPFYTTAERHALGLGVAVSRALVEAAGGTLELQPIAGGGTRALIRLARARP